MKKNLRRCQALMKVSGTNPNLGRSPYRQDTPAVFSHAGVFFSPLQLKPSAALQAQTSVVQIENAKYEGGPLPEGQSANAIVLQVPFDQTGSSPGIIDGWRGPMSRSAIRAFEAEGRLK